MSIFFGPHGGDFDDEPLNFIEFETDELSRTGYEVSVVSSALGIDRPGFYAVFSRNDGERLVYTIPALNARDVTFRLDSFGKWEYVSGMPERWKSYCAALAHFEHASPNFDSDMETLALELEFYMKLPTPRPTLAEWKTQLGARAEARRKKKEMPIPPSSLVDGNLRASWRRESTKIRVVVTFPDREPWKKRFPSLRALVDATPKTRFDRLEKFTGGVYSPEAVFVSLSDPDFGVLFEYSKVSGHFQSHSEAEVFKGTYVDVVLPIPGELDDATGYLRDGGYWRDMHEGATAEEFTRHKISRMSGHVESAKERAKEDHKSLNEIYQKLDPNFKGKQAKTPGSGELEERVATAEKLAHPEVCEAIRSAGIVYRQVMCEPGDENCTRIKGRFDLLRKAHDVECFRADAPADSSIARVIGGTLFRGSVGLYELSNTDESIRNSLAGGWSGFNEKFVTASFDKAGEYARFVGTSIDIESDWSVLMELDASKLSVWGNYTSSNERKAQEPNIVKALGSYLEEGELHPDEYSRERVAVFDRLRREDFTASGLAPWMPVVSLIIRNEVVWTPTVDAPPDAFQRAIIKAQVYHKAFFWAWASKQQGFSGNRDTLATKPHFVVTWGDDRVPLVTQIFMDGIDKAVVEYLKADLTAALGD